MTGVQTCALPISLPAELQSAKVLHLLRKIAGPAVVICFLFLWPTAWFIGLIIGAIIFFGSYDDSTERRARKAALDNARGEFEQNYGAASDLGQASFEAKLRALSEAKSKYLKLDVDLVKERATLSTREWQLRKYLAQIFIDDHEIPGIGPTRKAMLQSFQIETAADVDWAKVDSVPGFGWGLTNQLVNWRKSLEAKFQYDPGRGVDSADLAQVNNKYLKLKRELKSELVAGVEQLKKIRGEILARRASKEAGRAAAGKAYAQAKADYDAL